MSVLLICNHDFTNTNEQEMSCSKGDIVKLVEDEKNGWTKCENSVGLMGKIPTVFLDLFTDNLQSGRRIRSKAYSTTSLSLVLQQNNNKSEKELESKSEVGFFKSLARMKKSILAFPFFCRVCFFSKSSLSSMNKKKRNQPVSHQLPRKKEIQQESPSFYQQRKEILEAKERVSTYYINIAKKYRKVTILKIKQNSFQNFSNTCDWTDCD